MGSGGAKIGNPHLRWAFAEAVCLFLRYSAGGKRFQEKLAARHRPGKVLAILAARLGRAVYHMLRKKEAFDEQRFWHGGGGRQARTGSSSLVRPEEPHHAGN